MKKILIILVIIIIVILGFVIDLDSGANQNFRVIKPKIMDLSIKVEAVGKAYAPSLVNVATLANGEIKDFRVKLGDKLKKGDIIAILDDEKAKNDLAIEKSKLTSLKDELVAAEVYLNELYTKLKTQESLYNKGASSKENYLSAKTSYYNAKAKLSSIKAQITQTNANISTMQESLDETIVKAPIDGTVISVYASLGQTINSRQSSPTLIKLANLDEIEVRMQVSQNDLNLLKVGQKVIYTPLSEGSSTKEATINSIDNADVSVIDNVSSSGAVYYYARYFVNNNPELKIGIDVQNNIEIDVVKNALTLPINYINKDNKGYYVNIKDNSEIGYKQAYITLGKSDNFNIEITSGLSADDEVVITNDKDKKSK